jgi:hypothetical protein
MKQFLLGLAMVTCFFMLGAYACDTLKHDIHVPIHKWLMMSFFGLFFTYNFYINAKGEEN